MPSIHDLPSPAILIEARLLEHNLRAMQACCDAAGVQLWPHIKTHKMIPILRRQIELGAAGATCAKLSEAEALLPSGVRRIFLAHSLASPTAGARLRKLQQALDELIIAVTSAAHFEAIENLLRDANLRLPVLLAVDTGLNREGVRSLEEAKSVANRIRKSTHMEWRGIYTHEGQAYLNADKSPLASAQDVSGKLEAYKAAIGGEVPFWPGCSVTAREMVAVKGVTAVRPGAYVFGDLYLSQINPVMKRDEIAATIQATVVDKPVPDLALIDAGSKTFSSDKTPEGISGNVVAQPDICVHRLSEEHGFLGGSGIKNLTIGQRLRLIPAHICPVINLASSVYLVDGEQVLEHWPVDARGCVS